MLAFHDLLLLGLQDLSWNFAIAGVFTLRQIDLPGGLDFHVHEYTLSSEAELALLTMGGCSD